MGKRQTQLVPQAGGRWRSTYNSIARLVLLAKSNVQVCDNDTCCVCAFQVRVGFHGGEDLWVEDVLNIGVDPR